MGDHDLIVVATSTHGYEMQILRTFLEDHDIRAFLRDENMSNSYYGVAIGGVKLEVMRKDTTAALNLIAYYEDQSRLEQETLGRLSIAGEDAHDLELVPRAREVDGRTQLAPCVCPGCSHDEQFEGVPWSGAQIALIFLLLGLPLLFIKPKVRCPECGEQFSP